MEKELKELQEAIDTLGEKLFLLRKAQSLTKNQFHSDIVVPLKSITMVAEDMEYNLPVVQS